MVFCSTLRFATKCDLKFVNRICLKHAAGREMYKEHSCREFSLHLVKGWYMKGGCDVLLSRGLSIVQPPPKCSLHSVRLQ